VTCFPPLGSCFLPPFPLHSFSVASVFSERLPRPSPHVDLFGSIYVSDSFLPGVDFYHFSSELPPGPLLAPHYSVVFFQSHKLLCRPPLWHRIAMPWTPRLVLKDVPPKARPVPFACFQRKRTKRFSHHSLVFVAEPPLAILKSRLPVLSLGFLYI